MAANLETLFRNHPRCSHVELYWLPPSANANVNANANANANIVPLAHANQVTLGGPWSRMRPFEQRFVEYQHRDYTYVYDTANDAQRAIRRLALATEFGGGTGTRSFALLLDEATLPTHRFPSTTDITHRREFARWTTKINNRLQWIVDQTPSGYTHCLRYTHAANVDLTKMQEDLDRAWGVLVA